MRRLDENPIDPEIAAQLDAIDATLAGDPVDPQHAELAELALLLAAERPEPDAELARSLDARVARRFAPAAVPGAAPARRAVAQPRLWQRLTWKPIAGTLAAGLAAVVVVVAVGSAGGGGASSGESVPALTSSAAGAVKQPGTATSHGPQVHSPLPGAPQPSAGGTAQASAASAASPSPQPPGNGRKVVQSAQLALSAPANRIDAVAQEAFDVIGRENGIVDRSSVTATGGPDGYAQFELRVPSGSLGATMSALSSLRYARVASRTDNSQDVNDRFVSVTHRLADDRALRTALLKQLAAAVTQQQIDSLNARIHDAEAAIASDDATISGLNRQLDFSRITLSIGARSIPVLASHGGGSFTLGKAAHDAGRVLTVAAGVALIALAAMVPVMLVGALVWWIAAAIRHRRREQALDAA